MAADSVALTDGALTVLSADANGVARVDVDGQALTLEAADRAELQRAGLPETGGSARVTVDAPLGGRPLLLVARDSAGLETTARLRAFGPPDRDPPVLTVVPPDPPLDSPTWPFEVLAEDYSGIASARLGVCTVSVSYPAPTTRGGDFPPSMRMIRGWEGIGAGPRCGWGMDPAGHRRAEGSALISASHMALETTSRVIVRQDIAALELSGLAPYHVGAGALDTVRVRARDGNGNPIILGNDREISWSSTVPAVADLVSSTLSEGVVETASIGQTAITLSIQWCGQYGSCVLEQRSTPLTVLPEPDSVRIVSEWSTTIGVLGLTGAYFFGDIFLPGQTIERVEILWTSLDPGVATIGDGGQVTAYMDGTARLVGRMGAAADTVVLTIDTPR